MNEEVQNSVNFYKFFFNGVDKPIIIEAMNKDEAVGFLTLRPDYVPAPVVNLYVFKPLFGITEKVEDGVTFVWCGFQNSFNGWMEKGKFLALSRH